MRNFTVGFSHEKINIEIAEKNVISELVPNSVEVGLTGTDEVARSLANPIDAPRLRDAAKGKKNVVIITSDITRPVPSYRILPLIIEELEAAGVADDEITVVFALGSHRAHTEEEKKKLVGEEVYARVKCIDSERDDCVHMGTTQRGTPVDIFRPVAEADMRICVGNIEYHYFAGYSGGAKAIMPGVSTFDAIQSNHRFMVQDSAKAGKLDGNPVREDIEESGRICKVDYIVNVVLSEKKEILCCVSGDPVTAHRQGCLYLDKLYKTVIPRKADIVIVSPGGYPKDINLYQAQKALDNAGHAVRDGGIIIWVGSCAEGLGEKHFESWMTGHEKSSDMISHIKEEFVLGGHKAAAIAMILERARIMLVSDLDDDFVRKIFLEPKHSVAEALEEAYSALGEDAGVIVMPYGGSTLPVLE